MYIYTKTEMKNHKHTTQINRHIFGTNTRIHQYIYSFTTINKQRYDADLHTITTQYMCPTKWTSNNVRREIFLNGYRHLLHLLSSFFSFFKRLNSDHP